MNSVDATFVWNSIETRWPRKTGIDEAKAWMFVLLNEGPGVDRNKAMVILDALQVEFPDKRPAPAAFRRKVVSMPATKAERGAYLCEPCGGTTWVDGIDGVVRCRPCNGTGRTNTPPAETEVDREVTLRWINQLNSMVSGASC